MNSVFTILTSGILSLGILNQNKPDTTTPISNQQSVNKQVYISEWETNTEWSSSRQLYYYTRSIPQLDENALNNGLVLTYVKGYNFSNMPMTEKPLALPFQYFTPDETNIQSINWHLEKNRGEIKIGIQVSGDLVKSFNQYQKNIQLRYFILSPEFLAQHQLNKEKLRQVSYKEIVALTKVNP